jgi:hypothetical protein
VDAGAGERDNAGCALLSFENPSPSDNSVDEGGQESIRVICQSLQSEWCGIGGNRGYSGGGEKQGKAVDAGAGECNNVGYALLSLKNRSPSDNGVDEGGKRALN